MDLIAAIQGYFSTGGLLTLCPAGSACWPAITDPVVEYRAQDSDLLEYIGHDIENVSNNYKLPRRERA